MTHKLSIAIWLILLSLPSWAQSRPKLLEVQLAGGRESGLPIHWDAEYALLLKPSGAMLEVDVPQVQSHRILDDVFIPQPLTTARGLLQAEFGPQFETATIGPYVLCAPLGHVERWRERFRILLSGYSRYFESRGWRLRSPDFPLCVIILPGKAEFDRYCQQQIGKSMPSLMGYYFPKNNRCVLFEVGGDSTLTDWSETERTIIHEAVHQLAYNTGVHERLADNPQWVVEGLATMFEEPGVFDGRLSSRPIGARINPQQLATLKSLLNDPATLENQLGQLITGNELFKRDAQIAYALSWGLTFYLAERMSSKYGQYAQQLASLGKLQQYSSQQRASDFLKVFEVKPGHLAVGLQQFYSGL